MPLEIRTPTEFSNDIRQYARKYRTSFLDAVIMYCEESDIEPESAAKLLDSDLFLAIQQEASNLNLIEKSNTLPFLT